MERPAHQPSRSLPVHASHFVGRRRELAEVCELVNRSRLVTLTGAAGSGKSRFSLEVARRVASTRPGGSCLVELASLSEGELLPHAFAAALEIRDVKARQMLDVLQEQLAGFDGVLVVDNCEHLVEACAALVDRLLRRCPRLTVLATSREPLHVDGEVVWQLAPLSLPGGEATMRDVMRSESVALFVERARQVSPQFEINTSNALEMAAICRRLDGLPLAIELAAARISMFDLAAISEQLDDRFRFLTGGFRTAPQRQRTLRAAVDWSYDLLTAAERQLFDRLSVFAGGFDAAAAKAVGAGGLVLSGQVLDILGRLIDKSLVKSVDDAEEPRRYQLLDTLRAYGMERLRETGTLEDMRRRHAEYMAVLGGKSEADTSTAEWAALMHREVTNFREALSWSRSVDRELHLRLAKQYGWYCVRSGSIAEGNAWVGPALERGAADPASVSDANLAMAFLSWRQQDFALADRYASEAVRISRERNDEPALGANLGALSFVRIGAGAARGPIEEQLAIARRLNAPRMEAEALLNLGTLEAAEQDLGTALDHLSQSLALYEAAEGQVPATVYNSLGWTLLMLHRPAEARAAVDLGLVTRLRSRNFIDMSASLDASADAAFQLGALERAMRLIGAADAIRRRAGSEPNRLAAASRGRWMPQAERALGKAAHAAWLEGTRMTPEEAGAYALTPLDQPPRRKRTLSDREMEIADLVAAGLTNNEIAARLRLSTRTVEAHLDHIRTKLVVRTRVDVATWVTARSTPPPASQS